MIWSRVFWKKLLKLGNIDHFIAIQFYFQRMMSQYLPRPVRYSGTAPYRGNRIHYRILHSNLMKDDGHVMAFDCYWLLIIFR